MAGNITGSSGGRGYSTILSPTHKALDILRENQRYSSEIMFDQIGQIQDRRKELFTALDPTISEDFWDADAEYFQQKANLLKDTAVEVMKQGFNPFDPMSQEALDFKALKGQVEMDAKISAGNKKHFQDQLDAYMQDPSKYDKSELKKLMDYQALSPAERLKSEPPVIGRKFDPSGFHTRMGAFVDDVNKFAKIHSDKNLTAQQQGIIDDAIKWFDSPDLKQEFIDAGGDEKQFKAMVEEYRSRIGSAGYDPTSDKNRSYNWSALNFKKAQQDDIDYMAKQVVDLFSGDSKNTDFFRGMKFYPGGGGQDASGNDIAEDVIDVAYDQGTGAVTVKTSSNPKGMRMNPIDFANSVFLTGGNVSKDKAIKLMNGIIEEAESRGVMDTYHQPNPPLFNAGTLSIKKLKGATLSTPVKISKSDITSGNLVNGQVYTIDGKNVKWTGKGFVYAK